jgi:hypothetical protein
MCWGSGIWDCLWAHFVTIDKSPVMIGNGVCIGTRKMYSHDNYLQSLERSTVVMAGLQINYLLTTAFVPVGYDRGSWCATCAGTSFCSILLRSLSILPRSIELIPSSQVLHWCWLLDYMTQWMFSGFVSVYLVLYFVCFISLQLLVPRRSFSYPLYFVARLWTRRWNLKK